MLVFYPLSGSHGTCFAEFRAGWLIFIYYIGKYKVNIQNSFHNGFGNKELV